MHIRFWNDVTVIVGKYFYNVFRFVLSIIAKPTITVNVWLIVLSFWSRVSRHTAGQLPKILRIISNRPWKTFTLAQTSQLDCYPRYIFYSIPSTTRKQNMLAKMVAEDNSRTCASYSPEKSPRTSAGRRRNSNSKKARKKKAHTTISLPVSLPLYHRWLLPHCRARKPPKKIRQGFRSCPGKLFIAKCS